MTIRVGTGFAVVLVAVSLIAVAQDQKKQVKHVPAKETSPASGEEMFNSYCASCHGKDAKGDGPAASALNTPPADLTALAKKYDGKYPEMKVTSVLRGEAKVVAHGTQEMPVWGPVFWRMSQGHPAEVQRSLSRNNTHITELSS